MNGLKALFLAAGLFGVGAMAEVAQNGEASLGEMCRMYCDDLAAQNQAESTTERVRELEASLASTEKEARKVEHALLQLAKERDRLKARVAELEAAQAARPAPGEENSCPEPNPFPELLMKESPKQ